MTSEDCIVEPDSTNRIVECATEYYDSAEMSNSTSPPDYSATPGVIVINYEVRFAVYTALSVACLVFNAVSLVAMSHVPGPRTVHHRLLTNLAACDVVGTALLWMYYNSPYIFPRYKVSFIIVTARSKFTRDQQVYLMNSSVFRISA